MSNFQPNWSIIQNPHAVNCIIAKSKFMHRFIYFYTTSFSAKQDWFGVDLENGRALKHRSYSVGTLKLSASTWALAVKNKHDRETNFYSTDNLNNSTNSTSTLYNTQLNNNSSLENYQKYASTCSCWYHTHYNEMFTRHVMETAV